MKKSFIALKRTVSGVCAGILICIGGSVFLACENRYVGAVMFSVALLCICFKGYSLYTGKIGFIPEKHGREEFSVLLWGLLGNAVATFVGGLLIRAAIPTLGDNAVTICTSKLTQNTGSAFIRGIFCGILMYLAVSIFREKNSIVGIVFGIPVFILAGFEHSIADMFYFSAAGMFTPEVLLFIAVVIAGNTGGGMLLPYLGKIGSEKI